MDTGFWHPFTTSRSITVNDTWLRVQGVHMLYVRSRDRGQPLQPRRDGGRGRRDHRHRAAGVSFNHLAERPGLHRRPRSRHAGPARPLARRRRRLVGLDARVPPHPRRRGEAGQLNVETRDDEGNVGTATDAIVRGRFDGTAASCGSCVAAGSSSRDGGHALIFLGIAIAGLVGRNRKRGQKGGSAPKASRPVVSPSARRAVGGVARQAVGGAAMMAVAATWAGAAAATTARGSPRPAPRGRRRA